MSGAAVIIIIIVVRMLLSRGQSGDINIPPALWRFLARAVALGIGVAAYRSDAPAAVYLVCSLFAVPAPFIQCGLIPLGVPWLAYGATRLFRPLGLGPENRAGAVLSELRARLRWGLLLDSERLGQLSKRLRRTSNKVEARGASVASRGVLTALSGDREAARALFNLGQRVAFSTYGTRCYCQAWLLSDAAERGDWTEVLRLSRRGPRSSRRWFMRACAEQLLGIERRSKLMLTTLWLLAPGRLAARELLRLTLAAAPVRSLTPPEPTLASARDATLRLARLSPGLASRRHVRDVAEAWQRVFDDGVARSTLTQRLLALGWSTDVDSLASKLEQDVCRVLRDAWQHALPHSNSSDENHAETPWLLLRAQDELASELFSEIEPLVEQLPTGDSETTDDGIEELFRRWAEILWWAERYLDLFPNQGALFYDSVGATLLNHGSWLHNHEECYPLSHDIFRWLCSIVPPGHGDAQMLRNNQKLSRRAARLQ